MADSRGESGSCHSFLPDLAIFNFSYLGFPFTFIAVTFIFSLSLNSCIATIRPPRSRGQHVSLLIMRLRVEQESVVARYLLLLIHVIVWRIMGIIHIILIGMWLCLCHHGCNKGSFYSNFVFTSFKFSIEEWMSTVNIFSRYRKWRVQRKFCIKFTNFQVPFRA